MKAIRTWWQASSGRYAAADQDGNRVSIPKPDQYEHAHRDAAVALILQMGWEPVVIASGSSIRGEWVHVMLPRMSEASMRAVVEAGQGTLHMVEAR